MLNYEMVKCEKWFGKMVNRKHVECSKLNGLEISLVEIDQSDKDIVLQRNLEHHGHSSEQHKLG